MMNPATTDRNRGVAAPRQHGRTLSGWIWFVTLLLMLPGFVVGFAAVGRIFADGVQQFNLPTWAWRAFFAFGALTVIALLVGNARRPRWQVLGFLALTPAGLFTAGLVSVTGDSEIASAVAEQFVPLIAWTSVVGFPALMTVVAATTSWRDLQRRLRLRRNSRPL
jgi:hypothetical protein